MRIKTEHGLEVPQDDSEDSAANRASGVPENGFPVTSKTVPPVSLDKMDESSEENLEVPEIIEIEVEIDVHVPQQELPTEGILVEPATWHPRTNKESSDIAGKESPRCSISSQQSQLNGLPVSSHVMLEGSGHSEVEASSHVTSVPPPKVCESAVMSCSNAQSVPSDTGDFAEVANSQLLIVSSDGTVVMQEPSNDNETPKKKARFRPKCHNCEFCEKKFDRESALKRHVKIHTGARPYTCTYCDKAFKELGHVKRHERIHIGDKPHQCDFCDKSFYEPHRLREHQRVHSGVKPYCCKYCQQAFRHPSTLKSHVMIKHTGGQPYKCTSCPKAFCKPKDLRQHERTHSGLRPFKCSYCPKAFPRVDAMKIHERVHTNVKPFKCVYCLKCFSQSSQLSRHIKSHFGEKPYHCDVCGKSFSQSTTLQQHQKIHDGEKVHRCPFCEKAFTWMSSLRRHKMIHTGQKPHSCSQCERSFSRLDMCRKHEATHGLPPAEIEVTLS